MNTKFVFFLYLFVFCMSQIVSFPSHDEYTFAIWPAILSGLAGGVISGIGSLFGASKSANSNLQAQREANDMNLLLTDRTNASNEAIAALANRGAIDIANANNAEEYRRLLQTQRFNHNEAQLAFDREKQWYEAYNSPSADVQRKLAAGINPYTSEQQLGSIQSPSASSPSPNPMQSPELVTSFNQAGHVTPEIFDYSGIAESLKQIGSSIGDAIDTQLRVESHKADMKRVGAMIRSMNVENEYKDALRKSLAYDLNFRQATEGANIKRVTLQNDLLDAQILDLASQRVKRDVENNFMQFQIDASKYGLQQKDAEINLATKKLAQDYVLGIRSLELTAQNNEWNHNDRMSALKQQNRQFLVQTGIAYQNLGIEKKKADLMARELEGKLQLYTSQTVKNYSSIFSDFAADVLSKFGKRALSRGRSLGSSPSSHRTTSTHGNVRYGVNGGYDVTLW